MFQIIIVKINYHIGINCNATWLIDIERKRESWRQIQPNGSTVFFLVLFSHILNDTRHLMRNMPRSFCAYFKTERITAGNQG